MARACNNFNEIPDRRRAAPSPTARVALRRATGGIGFYDLDTTGKNLQFALKSTNIFNAGGNHQLRYGVQYEDIDYDRGINRARARPSRSPTAQVPATGAPSPDPARSRLRPDLPRRPRQLVPTVVTNQKYLNFFVQDTWQVGSA